MQQFQRRSTKCVFSALKSTTTLTVPDYSFVTRDIFKRNYARSSIIFQGVHRAPPPFSQILNRPPRLIKYACTIWNDFMQWFHRRSTKRENNTKCVLFSPKLVHVLPPSVKLWKLIFYKESNISIYFQI